MRFTVAFLLVLGCGSNDFAAAEGDAEFGNAARVEIRGYSDHAMEPFVTRDGRYLIFNNSNEPADRTDLHYAERVDDRTFDYRGKLDGANSAALDAVATADAAGNMYFITTRSYEQTLTTIYRAEFDDGIVRGAAPVAGMSSGQLGRVHFDVEVTADGNTLYFADGLFTGAPVPAAADLAIAVRSKDGGFRRQDDGSLAAINTSALEYAAAVSTDQLELLFTRVAGGVPGIYRSTRQSVSAPWEAPRKVSAIEGFTEAPALAEAGTALYYHARRNDRFVIERVTRNRQPGPRRRAVSH